MNKKTNSDIIHYKLSELIYIKKGKKVDSLCDISDTSALPLLNIVNLRGAKPEFFTNDSKAVKCMEEDILIAWDGSNAGIVATGLAGCIGSTIAKLEIRNRSVVDSEYLYYFLRWKEPFFRQTTNGAAIPHVNKRQLDTIQVPIPNIQNQKKIAKMLKKIDVALNKIEFRKIQFSTYLFSQYVELFIDNEDCYDWDSRPIKNLVSDVKRDIRTGPFGSDLLHSEFVNEGIAVIGIDNAVNNKFSWADKRYITKKKYSQLKRYTVYPGDVIVTIMGTTGRSAVIPDDIGVAINSKHLAAITFNKNIVNPYYISYSIHSNPFIIEYLEKNTRGAIMKGLNLGIIKELFLKIPPLELQNKFSEIVLKVESLMEKHEQLISNYNILQKSIMQRSFMFEKQIRLDENSFTYIDFSNVIVINFKDILFTFEDLKKQISKKYLGINYTLIKEYIFIALKKGYLADNTPIKQINHYDETIGRNMIMFSINNKVN